MGAGTIIATAIAIILLIITGYVLIGGTLSTARIVTLAQQAAAEKDAQRIHTRIEIFSAMTVNDSSTTFIVVNNTGSEVVGDFDHMEVFLLQDGTPYTYMNQSGYANWTYTIQPDEIHPGLLDPDEVANITIAYDPVKGNATWVKVITANGVYDSAYTMFV
jgi:flagellar protein FlaF